MQYTICYIIRNMSIDKFNPSSVAIAMTTYYPKWYRGKLRSIKHTDKIRGDLALKSIQRAAKLDYQVVVADGKSSRSFRKALSLIPCSKLIMRRPVKSSAAKRKAIRITAKLPNVKVIVLTEPEKVSLIKDFIPKIVEPILTDNVDIVVPKRNLQLFKSTYPGYQYESEIEANNLYNENLKSNNLMGDKEEFDWFFGPKAFRNDPKIISLFMKRYSIAYDNFSLPKDYFDPENYSNILFFPIIQALKKGLKVKSVEVPFNYPVLQKENEGTGDRELFMEKRKSQRLGLLVELMHFISYLEKNPNSGVKLIKRNH